MNRIEHNSKKLIVALAGMVSLSLALLVLSFGAVLALAAGPPTLGSSENWLGTPLSIIAKKSTRSSLGPFEVLINPGGAETEWRLEWTEPNLCHQEGGGTVCTWSLVPRGSGTISGAEADETLHRIQVSGELTGLETAETYPMRLVATNVHGTATDRRSLAALPFTPSVPSAGVEGTPHLTSIALNSVQMQPFGAETTWQVEWAPSENGHEPSASNSTWSALSGAGGTVPGAEAWDDDYKILINATVGGLDPETAYWFRVSAVNSAGPNRAAPKSIETLPIRPVPKRLDVRNPTTSSVRAFASVEPNGSETHWHYEVATFENGPWKPVAGAEGTISQAEAEAVNSEQFEGRLIEADGHIGGLSPATTYYLRLVAESEPEFAGHREHKRSIATYYQPFQTAGPPTATAFAVDALHGETVRIMGFAAANTFPVDELQTVAIGGGATGGTFKLCLEGQCTAPIAFIPHEVAGNTERIRVGEALKVLPKLGSVRVLGSGAGPYTLEVGGSSAGGVVPELTADASGLTPSGTVTVGTLENGETFDTHYHLEYVSQAMFAKNQWVEAQKGPEEDLGSGGGRIVGLDLPGLQAGETYHYRMVASNTTPGNPVVDSPEHTLVAPVPAEVGVEGACPNEPFRTGLSGHLPDCRAYEQISPADKQGAQEALKYATTQNTGTIVGEDGNHFMFMSQSTRWGQTPTSGQAPYFFARASSGWQMTDGSPQPEVGFDKYQPQVFSADLTQFALRSSWSTGAGIEGTSASAQIEFKAGPPGGPYATVATVPRADAPAAEDGWVAASEDLSKLILRVKDHTLLGHSTGTTSGYDLYEYAGGALHDVNVDSQGKTVGSCGANTVKGDEERSDKVPGSRHSVSSGGTRVFFEAVPGSECSGATHLYMREASAGKTLDVGPYRFAGADGQGVRVLLEKKNGQAREYFLYDTETGSLRPAFSVPDGEVTVARDFTAFYITTTGKLTAEAPPSEGATGANFYRYAVHTESLRFLLRIASFGRQDGTGGGVSPDGRYFNFGAAGVAGLPGGSSKATAAGEPQLYRYDSVQNVVECVSCASPFDPEPKLGIDDRGGALTPEWGTGGTPAIDVMISANGDYEFFETAAALVSQDVNGEIPPMDQVGTPSNDVYEWRRDGVNGCGRLQGCISLITPGTDGVQVVLLGSAMEGRDVFFYTHSQLLPRDSDTAGDFYDARIGGGFAEPAKPVECEGDACLSPLSAPIDMTPASLSFSGPGNLVSPLATPVHKAKPKAKPCTKGKCKTKRGRKGKRGRRARKAVRHGTVRGNAGGHR